MDIQSILQLGELGGLFIICQTLIEVVKVVVHKKRVSVGKAHDSLTREEHDVLMNLWVANKVYPEHEKFQIDTRMLSTLSDMRETLIRIESKFKEN